MQIETDKRTTEISFGENESEINPQSIMQQNRIYQKSTPLHFTLRINGSYYISYEKKTLWRIILISALWLVFNIMVIEVMGNMQNIGGSLKKGIKIGLIAQNILYFLLCVVDPGTIFQDQEEQYGHERTKCVTCVIYRIQTSRHCIWCNRCVQQYDHHCSVFGKCIGKRNIWLFYAFILLSAAEMPVIIISLIFSILKQG